MSKIEWTDRTWNPTRGCSRVNNDCDNCYAMRQAHRQNYPGGCYEGLTRIGKNGVDWSGSVRLVPEQLTLPLRWKKPQKIFVDSMSDLFHPSLKRYEIAAVFGVMALACHHTYQIATKRPWNMFQAIANDLDFDDCWEALDRYGISPTRAQTRAIRDALPEDSPFRHDKTSPLWPLPNVWLLVSAGTQESVNEFIPPLMRTPAAIRGLSAEPLRGPLDIREWLPSKNSVVRAMIHHQHTGHDCSGGGKEAWCDICRVEFSPDAPALDWVIAGGESGHYARPMHPGWALGLAHQCIAAKVPFFFKQWGKWKPVVGNAPRIGDQWVFAKGGFEPWTPTNHAPFSAERLKEGPHAIMRAEGKKSDSRRLDGRLFEGFPQ